jgi:enoyl-CoA hydratase/carnithine racemase
MAWDTVLYDVDDGIATVTLNRPERLNAWTDQLAAELSAALDAADADDAVRSIIITGAGRAFCAGADLEKGGDTFDRSARPADDTDGGGRPDAPIRLPYDLHKPVIAAINGAAVGVGITYPLLADVRIVAEDAKISFAFVRRGMIPELGSHAILPRVLGLSNAADLLLSGRMISGREAAQLGLASAAVPAGEVLATARAHAREYAAAAPVSVAIAKRLVWDNLRPDIEATTRRENPLFTWVGQQADAREGIESFLQRRPPAWKLSPARDLPSWPTAT